MKKVFLLLFLSVAAVVSAQDVLVTEDGESITAYDVDISGAQKIYYKTAVGDDAPMKSIAKERVLLWKKADGTKVRIGEGNSQKQTVTSSAAKVQHTPAPDASDSVANNLAIKKFNTYNNIHSLKEPQSKPGGKNLIGVMKIKPESVIADKNVELLIEPFQAENSRYWTRRGMKVIAKNKTDRTIYVYLGNTFFIRNDVATPFTHSSASQSNKDGQAAAATSFSQNVVAIPAQSSMEIGADRFITKDAKLPYPFFYNSAYNWGQIFYTKSDLIEKYAERELTPKQSLNYGFKMAYSFGENDTQIYNLDAQLYVAKLIHYNWMSGLTITDPNHYVTLDLKQIRVKSMPMM